MGATVEATITMRLLGHPSDRGTPVLATFRYDSERPFAVETAFHLSDVDVVWTYARGLLLDGLQAHSGQGDVRVWPLLPHPSSGIEPMVRMELSSPTGHALLETESTDLRRFLDRSLAVCPEGEESALLDIDSWLASLLQT